MTGQSYSKHRTLILVLGAIAFIWSILGVMDRSNQSYSGFWTDGNDTVIRIFDGSPAQGAGLMVGDYIKSYGGIPNTDTKALTARGRADIGETRTLVVDRNGSEAAVDVTYSGLPAKQMMLGHFGSLLGLVFLLCGLWAFTKVDTKPALLLALLGVSFGFFIGGGAYFESAMLRKIVGVVTWVAIVVGFAALFHFALEYPRPRKFAEKANAARIIYGPAVLVLLILAWLILFTPSASSGLNQFISIVIGIFAFGYFGLALVTFVQTYRGASESDRDAYGLTLIVVGSIIGLLPVTISFLVGIFAPKVVLPGTEFYFLTLVLVPIVLMLGVLKSAGVEADQPAAPATEPEPAQAVSAEAAGSGSMGGTE